MKKFLAILLSLVLILTFFTACGAKGGSSDDPTHATGAKAPTDEEMIKADLQKELLDDDYGTQMAAELKKDAEFMQTAEEMGLDVDAYCAAFVKHYKFEIGEVTVNGDTGVGKVVMTYPDFEGMDALLDEKLDAYMAENDTSNMSQEEASKLVCDMMMAVLNDENFPELTQEFDMDYTKTNGVWALTDREVSEAALKVAMGLEVTAD